MSVLSTTLRTEIFFDDLQKVEAEQIALAICGVCAVEMGGAVVFCCDTVTLVLYF